MDHCSFPALLANVGRLADLWRIAAIFTFFDVSQRCFVSRFVWVLLGDLVQQFVV
jgi:hypothetical protein